MWGIFLGFCLEYLGGLYLCGCGDMGYLGDLVVGWEWDSVFLLVNFVFDMIFL